MYPVKNENKGMSTPKSTIKYTFVAPGCIAKGRGRGLKSLSSPTVSSGAISFSSSINPMIRKYNQVAETKKEREQEQGIKRMSTFQEMQGMNKKLFVKGHMQARIPSFSTTEEVVQYIEKGDIQKEQALGDMCSYEHVKSGPTKSTTQDIRLMNKINLVDEEDHVQADIPASPPPYQLTQSIRIVGTSDLRKERGLTDACTFEDAHQSVISRPSKSTKPAATQGQGYAAQGLLLLKKRTLDNEEEQVQDDISVFPSSNHLMQSTPKTRSSLGIPGNIQSLVHDKEKLRSQVSISPSTNHYEPSCKNNGASSGIRGSTQGMRMVNKQSLVQDKEQVQAQVPISTSANQFMLSTQKTERSSGIRGNMQGMRLVNKQSLVHDKEELQAQVPISLDANDQFEPSNKKTGASSGISGNAQGMRMVNKQSLAHDKEHVRAEVPLSPSTGHAMPPYQTTERSSEIPRKIHRVRGSNKCREVASLQVGQRLKVTFFNNRTVGENDKLFSRHLGKLVRDRNMCPLAVPSWKDIKPEKLNHMWAAVKDKFESDDMDIHREHILSWMRELWNKWRGSLHENYVKDRPIQEALKNVPKGVDKHQWEWLLKQYFSTPEFQARSQKNAQNRAKLKMLPRVGSRPIRELIYQKGGKDGNPPNVATIFFESRKLNGALADIETIEKHAQMQQLSQSEPSLSSIEIVEKCFGPQRSHVFGFGGGVTAKDLKGGTTSKANLWSELRLSREENQCLKDRLSNMENEIKEMKQIKEWVLAQKSKFHPPTSESPASPAPESSGE